MRRIRKNKAAAEIAVVYLTAIMISVPGIFPAMIKYEDRVITEVR